MSKSRNINEALSLVRTIDQDDAIFVACALAYRDSILWSDDKRLKFVQKINVFNTFEMIGYFMQQR